MFQCRVEYSNSYCVPSLSVVIAVAWTELGLKIDDLPSSHDRAGQDLIITSLDNRLALK